MNTVHRTQLILIEQAQVGFYDEKTFELCDNARFHMTVRGQDEGTAKAYTVICVVPSRDERRLL